MKGIRIHSIVRELANENIDVINYSDDIALYIARALAPAKLKDIYLDKANKVAKIVADEDQISLIIGKNGQNIKLASKLTGYEIDVERKSDKPRDIEEALERELERAAAENNEDDDDADEEIDNETEQETESGEEGDAEKNGKGDAEESTEENGNEEVSKKKKKIKLKQQ